MYCSSPLISSPSTPTTRASRTLIFHHFRHPSPPFTFHHQAHKHLCRIRPNNLTIVKVNSTHKPVFSTPNLPTKKPNDNPFLFCIVRPIAYAVFWVALGLCPFRPFPPPAIAVSVSVSVREEESMTADDYVEMLLKGASDLNAIVQKVRDGKGGLNEVELTLEKVKDMKRELSDQIGDQLARNAGVLNNLKEDLEKNLEKNLEMRWNSLENLKNDSKEMRLNLEKSKSEKKLKDLEETKLYLEKILKKELEEKDSKKNLRENLSALADHIAYNIDDLIDEADDCYEDLLDDDGDNSDEVIEKLEKIMQAAAKNFIAYDQLAKRTDDIEDQIEGRNEERVEDRNEERVEDRNEERVEGQIQDRVEDRIEDKIEDQIEVQIEDRNKNQIEDQIRGKESENKALIIALKKLIYIENQCVFFVGDFTREMMEKRIPSTKIPASSATQSTKKKSSLTKLSRSEIQKDLQSAQRQFLEQMILPKVVENEEIGNSSDQEPMEYSQRLKKALEESKEAQKNLEASLRKNLKKLGEEKRVLVYNTPEDIMKGFPEVELKWMFGSKEIGVPNAAEIYLYHGWRKWVEEFKDEQKRNLLENVEAGKKFVAERQERVLLERDKVMSHTWFNEKKKRWEMEPAAAHYAVCHKLVKRARIMSNKSAMYLFLKGDEKEYYVDLEVFKTQFEDFGGFDALFLQMVAAGIRVTIERMGIPDTMLTPREVFLWIKDFCKKCCNKCWTGLVNSEILLFMRDQILQTLRFTFDDFLVLAIIPAIDSINTFLERRPWGLNVLKYADRSFNWTFFFTKWQSDMGRSFQSRNNDVNFFWLVGFAIRAIACVGLVLFPLVGGFYLVYLVRGAQEQENVNRVKTYFRYKKRRMRRRKGSRMDPITSAFDHMKRVKNPPIQLKDFANVDSMREEVNEVVSFLQNPHAYKEMGARAPRGVLIVGESGSGKTSLALAIAAEARVPVVNVKGEQLEAGSVVGQGASNIRELFQTARDLAPVIIFVEDFDVFAGVRGTFLDTKKQDHEAFINQLLVELDGFEKQEGVVLIATTQSIHKIDKALTRPGRMDRIIHLQRPTQGERERILRSAAKDSMDRELVDFVDWGKVAEKTALMRPVELKTVPPALEGSAFHGKLLDADELMFYCSWLVTLRFILPTWVKKIILSKRISKMLVNHLGLELTKEDMENAIDVMEPYGVISSGIDLTSPTISWTRETKFPHAVWAAGRGLIGALLPNFDIVHNIWLDRSSSEGFACTKITKEESGVYRDGTVESRSYLEKKLVFLFGSYVAAQMLLPFGEENVLSSAELKKAQEIATRLVIQYGWGPSENPTIYYNNSVTTLSMGENHVYEMASNVEKLYYLAYDRAKAILQSNRSVLEKVVEELVHFEVLERKDLERIISENGGTREIEPFFLSKGHGEQQPQPVFGSLLENGSVSGSVLIISDR